MIPPTALKTRLNYWPWRIPVYALVMLSAIVILALVLTAVRAKNPIQLLSAFGLARYLRNTAIVGIPVLVLTQIMGIGLARLCVFYRFFGQRIVLLLLIVPMAIPAYVYTFIGVDMLQYGGTLYTALGMSLGKTGPYLLLVLSMTLSKYPYVFIFAYTYLSRHSQAMIETASCLQAKRWTVFVKVELPLCIPVIAVSSLIIFFEYLNEFAAHNYLGYPTISSVLYKIWYEFGSFESAALLAIILSIPTMLLLVLYLRLSFTNYGSQSHALPKLKPQKASRRRVVFIYATCLLPVGLGVLLPISELLQWSLHYSHIQDLERLFFSTVDTLTFVVIVLLSTTFVSMFSSYALHLNKMWNKPFLVFLFLPYALPGTVFAISALAVGIALGINTLHIGNISLLLLLASVLRFVAVPLRTTSLALFQRNSRYEEIARSQGHSPLSVFFRLVLHLDFPFIAAASLFVILDLIKELPLTLTLRNIHFEPIAVYIYTHVENSQVHSVALPTLLLITIGLGASILISRRTI